VFLVLAVLALPGPGNIAMAGDGDDEIRQLNLLHGPKFLAVLLGVNETPPVETLAQGASLIKLNEEQTMLGYLVAVHRIQNVTAAHIHCGAPGVAGPVVVPLFPKPAPPGGPTTHNVFLVWGMAIEEDITPVPDSEECPGGISTFAELVEKMHSGMTYVNVHTEQYPAGEVRGQNYPFSLYPPPPIPPALESALPTIYE